MQVTRSKELSTRLSTLEVRVFNLESRTRNSHSNHLDYNLICCIVVVILAVFAVGFVAYCLLTGVFI